MIDRLANFGFADGNYTQVIVSWGWEDDVPRAVEAEGIELWDFRQIIRDIAEQSRSVRTYFTDDTMRTLQLMAKATM